VLWHVQVQVQVQVPRAPRELARLSRLSLAATSLKIQATGAPAWDAAVQHASTSLSRVGRHTDCHALMLHAREHRHMNAHLILARRHEQALRH